MSVALRHYGMTSRSFPGRHKAQQEEEDAAALKLGPGTFEDARTPHFDRD